LTRCPRSAKDTSCHRLLPLTWNLGILGEYEASLRVLETVLALCSLPHCDTMLREIQHGIDHPRDQLFRVAFGEAGFLPSDPVFEVARFDVLLNPLAAVLPAIVADGRIRSRLPQLCRQPRGQDVRSRPAHVVVHPVNFWIGRRLHTRGRSVRVTAVPSPALCSRSPCSVLLESPSQDDHTPVRSLRDGRPVPRAESRERPTSSTMTIATSG